MEHEESDLLYSFFSSVYISQPFCCTLRLVNSAIRFSRFNSLRLPWYPCP